MGRILRHRLHNHRVAQAEPADPTRVQNLERRCGHPLRRKRLLCPGLVETQRENVTRSPGERNAQHLHCLREFPLGLRETIKTLKQVEDEVNLQRGEPHPRRRQRGFQADAQDLMSLPCQYKVDRFHRFEDRLHRQPFTQGVVARLPRDVEHKTNAHRRYPSPYRARAQLRTVSTRRLYSHPDSRAMIGRSL